MTKTGQSDYLGRLARITHSLNQGGELRLFLEQVIASASELIGCEWAAVLEHDPADDQLHFIAVPWFHSDVLRNLAVPLDGSLEGAAFRSGARLAVRDVPGDGRHFAVIDRVTGHTTRSMLAVPIAFRGQPIGVLEAINKASEADYTEEDVTILEALAGSAGIAIHAASAERQSERTREEGARLDRMKNDFIAIASHELRTPLGLILGHATFLREVIGDDHREQLDIIIRNATRLKDIIESMSNVDNFQSGLAVVRRRTVSIRRLVQELVDSFQTEAQARNIALRVDMDKSDLMVEGDAEKIGIAIGNIIKNAITFTNDHGHVFVVAEQIPGYVKIMVIDDGIGIPASDLAQVFERFYQVESHLTRRHGGMGLGLSVAKMMVEMHGGRIWAESVEGKGSNFTTLLPLDSSQAQAAERVFTP